MRLNDVNSEQWFTILKPHATRKNRNGLKSNPFFFNRMFNETETKYWPIELEMAGLV